MGTYLPNIAMQKDKAVSLIICPSGNVYYEHFEIAGKAVSVPPHGDLIERKAIYLTDFEIAMCDSNYKEVMKMLLEKIESAPTIIPAEETAT